MTYFALLYVIIGQNNLGVFMGMPLDLVFVRHGESEANVLQKAEKEGRESDFPRELRERPDWMHRLTPNGEEQAKVAGAWILEI